MASEKDLEIKCVDCGTFFSWTEEEQQFYKQKQLNQPKRCKPCRRKKREAMQSA